MRTPEEVQIEEAIMESESVSDALQKVCRIEVSRRKGRTIERKSGISCKTVSNIARNVNQGTTLYSAEGILSALGYELAIRRKA